MSENIQSMSDALKANNPRSDSVPSNETGALPTALTSSGVPTLQSPGQIPATASAPSVAKPTSSKRTRSQKAAKAPSNPTADKAPTALAGVQSTEAPTETDPATAALASRLGLDAEIPKLTTKSSDLAEWDDEAISKLVERAIAAAKAGNHDDSDLYFSMYRSVCTMKKPVGGKSVEVPKLALSSRAACSKSHAISTRAQEIVEVSSNEASEPGDLQFADEAMPRHDEMGPKIAHSCYATARKNSELEFTDNPYAEGGARSNWDPTTGAPKHAEKKTAAPKATQPAQSTSGPNLPAKPTKAPRSGGYKGTNFIENYKPGQSGSQGPKPAL
ncbi:hypothetical protein H4Q26_002385 [Puccinia striiformis f. sp. tritici PST-130]|nr:hypothetical protein H4Q26_002385 [Puccinia striiformis f. sp. tritici PST-130]